jgi:circadian clock protein KaiB
MINFPDELELDEDDIWDFYLYIAGKSAKSTAAIANLQKICDEYLQNKYKIKIIDLVQNPEMARQAQIIAVPTLIKKLPSPVKQIIGDLSNQEKLLVGLEIAITHRSSNQS